MSKLFKGVNATFIGFAFLFIWLPLLAIIVFSFNEGRYAIYWQGFTLHWYYELLRDTLTLNAFRVSVIVTSFTVLISTAFGTLAAYGIYKYKFWGKEILRGTLILPLVMPCVIMGISLLLFFSRVLQMPLGYVSIIAAHVAFSIPLVTFIVLARMQRVDWTLEEAAMDLGANRLTTWRRVIIPMLTPGILASVALTIPWSFNDFVITFFVTGVGTTPLPVRIYSMIRLQGISPVINALGTIVVVGSILIILAVQIGALIRQKRAEAAE